MIDTPVHYLATNPTAELIVILAHHSLVPSLGIRRGLLISLFNLLNLAVCECSGMLICDVLLAILAVLIVQTWVILTGSGHKFERTKVRIGEKVELLSGRTFVWSNFCPPIFLGSYRSRKAITMASHSF